MNATTIGAAAPTSAAGPSRPSAGGSEDGQAFAGLLSEAEAVVAAAEAASGDSQAGTSDADAAPGDAQGQVTADGAAAQLGLLVVAAEEAVAKEPTSADPSAEEDALLLAAAGLVPHEATLTETTPAAASPAADATTGEPVPAGASETQVRAVDGAGFRARLAGSTRQAGDTPAAGPAEETIAVDGDAPSALGESIGADPEAQTAVGATAADADAVLGEAAAVIDAAATDAGATDAAVVDAAKIDPVVAEEGAGTVEGADLVEPAEDAADGQISDADPESGMGGEDGAGQPSARGDGSAGHRSPATQTATGAAGASAAADTRSAAAVDATAGAVATEAATPTAETPGRPSSLPASAQVASAVAAMRRQGEGEYVATLDLHPAELGRVRIEVQIRAGVVNVAVAAEHAGTRSLFTDQLADLRSALEQGGMSAGDLDVSQQSFSDQQTGEEQADQARGQSAGALTDRATAAPHAGLIPDTRSPSSVSGLDIRL